MSNLTPAEQKVRRLARLPGNTECPNCGLQKKFGFSTICIKFGTFVCNECKSSHQAISHRCKSLTMSSWEMSEVDLLERTGNDHARNTWLQHAPPCGTGGRPQPGSDIGVFKNFVLNAYERRKFYGESNDRNSHTMSTNTQVRGVPKPTAPMRQPAPAPTPAPAPAPANDTDLLDFGSSFADDSSPAPATMSVAGDNDFGAFQRFATEQQTQNRTTPKVEVLSNAPPSIIPTSFDPFSTATAPVSFSSAPDSSQTLPPPSKFGDFDAFASTSAASVVNPTSLSNPSTPFLTQPQAKKPIMGNNSSSIISNMGSMNQGSVMSQQQAFMFPNNAKGQSSAPYNVSHMLSTSSTPVTNGAFLNPMGAYPAAMGGSFVAPMPQQPFLMPQQAGMMMGMNGMTNHSSMYGNAATMYGNASPSHVMGASPGFPANGGGLASSLARPSQGTKQSQNSGTNDKFADLCKF